MAFFHKMSVLTLRECKTFFKVIQAPCLSDDRGAQKRVLDLHQGLAEEALDRLADEALEREEARIASLERVFNWVGDRNIETLQKCVDGLIPYSEVFK